MDISFTYLFLYFMQKFEGYMQDKQGRCLDIVNVRRSVEMAG